MDRAAIRYEKTIDLKYLMRKLLKKWYVLLAVMLILGGALGAQEYLTNGLPRTESVHTDSEIAYYKGVIEKHKATIGKNNEQLELLVRAQEENQTRLARLEKKQASLLKNQNVTLELVVKLYENMDKIAAIEEENQEIAEEMELLENDNAQWQGEILRVERELEKTREVPFRVTSVALKAVLGAALGAMLFVVWTLLRCFFDDRMQSPHDMWGQFGIPVLAAQQKLLDAEAVAQKIRLLVEDRKDVLLVSTLEEREVQDFAEQLEKACLQNELQLQLLCKTTAAAELQTPATAVVFAEKMEKTSMKELQQLLQQLRNSQKQLLGAVVLPADK